MTHRKQRAMFYAISWLVVLFIVGLWSAAAWAFNAVAVWTISNADKLSAAAPTVEGLRLPEWLAPWVPPEISQLIASLLPSFAATFEKLLHAAPMLAGGITAATWVVWAFGTALLVLLGAGLHLLIAIWRRRHGGPTAGTGRSVAV